jgi:hypothetical protein
VPPKSRPLPSAFLRPRSSLPANDPPRHVREAPPAGSSIDPTLAAWLERSAPEFDRLLELGAGWHSRRMAGLRGAAEAARKHYWWPFTQHAQVNSVQVGFKTKTGLCTM